MAVSVSGNQLINLPEVELCAEKQREDLVPELSRVESSRADSVFVNYTPHSHSLRKEIKRLKVSLVVYRLNTETLQGPPQSTF